MNKIIILFIIPSFAGGGAEYQLCLLGKALIEQKLQVHVAYLHDGPNLDLAKTYGLKCHKIDAYNNIDPCFIIKLCQLINKIKPALVQTWLLHSDITGYLAASITRLPWILTERSSGNMYQSSLKFYLRKKIGLKADAIIANSKNGLSYWLDEGYSGLSDVIKNVPGTNLACSTKTVRCSRKPIIISICRLSKEKNLLILLRALELVFKISAEAKLYVFGEGPEELELKKYIYKSSILTGRVELLGYKKNVTRYLKYANLFVSLSSYEGSPNAVNEAIIANCPVILSDIPAHREFLIDESCFVLTDDHEVIAERIIYFLSNNLEAEKYLEKERRKISEWSAEKAALRYISVYNNVLKLSFLDYVSNHDRFE